jgi:hypothetical protein
MIDGVNVNQQNREKLVRYVLMTDFQSSTCYSHLECFKEQLSEIEDVV